LLKPARITQKLQQPHSWQQLGNGQWVFEGIQMRIDEWAPKLFGYHMLKLGGLSCELNTSLSTIPHQVNLDIKNPLHSVIADAFDLPFVEKSFDVVLLSHQLDYCQDPHRLLREVDRVMMDDGYIILTGFNPISFSGVASVLPWRKKNLPWSGRMFTPHRVHDWLGLLNYQVIHSEQYALFPNPKQRAIWAWLENMCGNSGSTLGSLYYIVARKRTYPIKPLKPHWRLKRRLSPVGVSIKAHSRTN
jgi:SAM-dependent methyltransferase